MKSCNWNNFRLLLIIFVMIFLYAFASIRNKTREISNIEVEFQGNTKSFLTNSMVNNLLIQNLGGALKIQKERVALKVLEKALNKHPFVENTEIFSSEDGLLITKITQKTPIARLVTNNNQFYLDKNGSVFQLSNDFSARVPIIYGKVDGKFKKELVETCVAIAKDDFLKKNIISVEIANNGSMKMLARDYDYEILFGKPISIEKKFKNYKAFYQFAAKDSIIKSYKSVNLIFTQQVVCSK
jgi:cell division protein FtsQ